MSETRPAFVRFEKDLYDALLSAPLSHSQLLVTLVVVRLTIGHRNRCEGAPISLGTFVARTGLSRTGVRAALAQLCRAGVLVKSAPPSGRRATTFAVQTDSAKWRRYRPGKSRPKRSGQHAENFGRQSVVCHADDTLRAVVCHADDTQGATQTTHYGPLCATQMTPSEEALEEGFSEGESGAAAEASPLSPDDQERHLTEDEGRELLRQHLADVAAARRKAALSIALSGES